METLAVVPVLAFRNDDAGPCWPPQNLQENGYDTGLTLHIPQPHFKLLPACCLAQNDFSA